MALGGFLVEIDAIGFQRIGFVLLLAGLARVAIAILLVLFDTAGGTRVGKAGALGDAVRDVVDRVIARHILLLQEIGGMTFTFGEDGDQHIGPGHLFTTGRMHVYARTLAYAPESRC